VGSNITNPLVAIGLGGMVSTYWVPAGTIHWDMPWQAGAGIILWLVLAASKGRLNKINALYLIALYALYIGLRAVFFAVD
jgi:cation:H+ antiporter